MYFEKPNLFCTKIENHLLLSVIDHTQALSRRHNDNIVSGQAKKDQTDSVGPLRGINYNGMGSQAALNICYIS